MLAKGRLHNGVGRVTLGSPPVISVMEKIRVIVGLFGQCNNNSGFFNWEASNRVATHSTVG